MNQREIEKAIEREVEEWPDASVAFVQGGKHPKAKLSFGGMIMPVTFAGTPTSSRSIHHTLADIRRALRKLGATRPKPEPSQEEDEAPYRKPNDGAEQRPDPVSREPVGPKASVADKLEAAGIGPSLALTGVPITAVLVDEPDEGGGLAPDEEEARRAALMEQVAAIVDGVYFGLPDVVYHAVPRISSSGLQRLCVSPATFWRGSWLDPDAPELDEEQTAAQALGKAYHVARLEPERFHDTYCRKPQKGEFGKDLISSDTAVKAALKELGEPQTAGTESTVDRALRLREAGCEKPIWALIEASFEHDRGERVPIAAEHFDQIVTDMQRVRDQGEVAELLVGGAAEVSVFWTDEKGLKCKCRFDYLTPGWWVDFKTFDNSRGKVLEQALTDAIRFNRYYVQAVHYRDGVEAVRVGGLRIVGEATEAQRQLVARLQLRPEELDCHYVFQEKGGVPNLIAWEFPFYDVPVQTRLNNAGATAEQQAAANRATRQRTGIFGRGAIDVRHAKDQFILYATSYDPGTPWFPLQARRRGSDSDFNSRWLEGND